MLGENARKFGCASYIGTFFACPWLVAIVAQLASVAQAGEATRRGRSGSLAESNLAEMWGLKNETGVPREDIAGCVASSEP